MAFDQIIVKGATSQILEVTLRDSTTGLGKTGVTFGSVTGRYMREGAAANVSITMATASLGTWASGGWIEVDATNQRGLYQFGIPNAALVTGANAVTITFQASGAIDAKARVVLVGADLRDAAGLGLSRIDAAISSRSTYAGADTAGTTTILSRVTSGPVATQTDVLNISNNTLVRSTIPAFVERPDSGSETPTFVIELYDESGSMEIPDSAPTVALVNNAGTDLSSRLSALSNPSTGRYTFTYTNSVGDSLEWLRWTVTVVEGGATRTYSYGTWIVDTTAADFTAADRTKLSRLDTDYTTTRAGKLDNLDVAVGTRSTYAGGAVASVTAGVTLAANQDVRNVLGTLTSTERVAIRDAILNRVLAGNHDTAGTPGLLLQLLTGVSTQALLAAAEDINALVELARTEIDVVRGSMATATGVDALENDIFNVGTLVTDAQDALSNLSDRVGAFSGTGANTILGFIRAVASKSATNPGDMGGSYRPDEDSLEALTEALAATENTLENEIQGVDAKATDVQNTLSDVTEDNAGTLRFTAAALALATSSSGATTEELVAAMIPLLPAIDAQNRVEVASITTAAALVINHALQGSSAVLYRRCYNLMTFTGIGNISDRTRLVWAMRSNPDVNDPDDLLATLLVQESKPADPTDGLLRMNGVPVNIASRGLAVMTVTNEVAGNGNIVFLPGAVPFLPQGFYHGLKVFRASGVVAEVKIEGMIEVLGTTVQEVD